MFFQVGLNAEVNKMNFLNLSIVFAPTMVRPQGDDLMKMMENQKQTGAAMHTLIEDYEFIFVCKPIIIIC